MKRLTNTKTKFDNFGNFDASKETDPYWTTLSIPERKQLIKDVKALNQRMTDLEKSGMANTEAYRNLQSWALSMGHHQKGTITKADGTTATTWRAVQTDHLTPEQIARTRAIKANPFASRGGEVKKVKKMYKEAGRTVPSAADMQKVADRMGQLHDFINDYKNAYYGLPAEKSGGIDLHDAVKQPRRLSLDEAEGFFRLMDNTAEAIENNSEHWADYLTGASVSE